MTKPNRTGVVLELFENLTAKELPARMQAMKEIALVHDALGNYAKLNPCSWSYSTKVSRIREGHEEVIDTQIDLAKVYRRIGKLEQAETRRQTSLLNDQNRSDTDSCCSMYVRACHDLLAWRNSPKAKALPGTHQKSRIRYGDAHASSLRVGQILVEALRKETSQRSRGALDRSGRGLERILAKVILIPLERPDSWRGF